MLPPRTQPEMPVIQQKLCSVFLRGNGIIMDHLYDLGIGDIDFITARRPAISSNFASHYQCRLLADRFEGLPNLGLYRVLHDYALHHACAVSQLRKKNLAARA